MDGGTTPSDGSLKVPRANKQGNRWSGLWGASNKVKIDIRILQIMGVVVISVLSNCGNY